MSENKVKKPMSKAKKDLIAWIIFLVAGIIFVVTGSIMVTIMKGNRLAYIICGSLIIVFGATMIGLSIWLIIKNKKLMDKEKTVQQA